MSHILRRERFVSSCCKNANLIRGYTHFLRNALNKHTKLLKFVVIAVQFTSPLILSPGLRLSRHTARATYRTR